MERYAGIKFKCQRADSDIDTDERLLNLDKWVALFAELGLAPVHSGGAYGNHSFRVGEGSFLITRSGMVPQENLNSQNYCLVQGYNEQLGEFRVRGRFDPSSESLLHLYIYRAFPQVNTIMHGHSNLLIRHAASLKIPVTSEKHPYGTLALAQSAVELICRESHFILLKEHGFVAIGNSIDITGKIVLNYYAALLDLLRKQPHLVTNPG